MAVEVKVPAVGESVHEVQIVQWHVQEGQFIEKDRDLVEIDSEKASMQIPAPASGVVSKIAAGGGAVVAVGDVIGHIDESVQTPVEKPAQVLQDTPARQAAAGEQGAAGRPVGDGREARVMPAAARVLSERGLSAAEVPASGPGGRLLKEDVVRYAPPASAAEPVPVQAVSAPSMPVMPAGDREEEIVPMSMIRRHIARRLVEVQQQAALLTTFNEADMSAVIALREKYRDAFQQKYGVKLGFMSFFAKAVVESLKRYPQLNAEIRQQNIVYKNYYDIGIAIGGGKGLVVPVLRNVERLSFAEIEKAIGDFGARAKEGKIAPEELEGGTFTISNGGVYGSMLSTPIVNPPQSGILGLHAIQDRPVAVAGKVEIRPMMYLALTYDHRIVDGREAVRFLLAVKQIIEDPARIILEV
jgi:2-oxoglutarate dehydrogenase E2 component (dihydrolipoamide succinyltransferase)